MEEKVRLNAACHGDQTVALTRNEMDYCWRRLKGDGMFADEIARKLRVERAELAKWEAAGRALRGRDKYGNPVDVFEPVKVAEFVAAPTPVGGPPKPEDIKPQRLESADPALHPVLADPLVAAAMDVRRTATALAEARRAHEAAVERLDDEIFAVKFPEAVHPATSDLEAPASVTLAPDEAVDLAAVRAWAKEQGIPVAPKGRVAAEVIERYREAQAS